MKISIVFFCVLALSLAIPIAEENQEIVAIPDREIVFDLSKEFVEEFLEVSKSKNVETMRAVINDYVDQLMANVDSLFIHLGLDPTSLPNVTEPLRAPLKVGEIKLTHGWLQGLSSIKRGGDIVVIYEPTGTNTLETDVCITFGALTINYDYSAKLMHIGPRGGVEAKITKLQVKFHLQFDFDNYQAALRSFKVPHSGHIDVNFSGHALTDWVFNLFIDVTTSIFHRLILYVMDEVIKTPIEHIIETINQILEQVLNPTTTTTTTAVTPVKIVMQSLNNF